MRPFTFKRGVVLPEHKNETARSPIVSVGPKPGAEMVFPVLQHSGAPATLIVQPGDYVRAGQKIAEAGAGVSAHVHSSVSGHVKEIQKALTPDGVVCDAVVVINDGCDEQTDDPLNRDYAALSPGEIVSIVKEAGVTGLGGAGFPTHIKLSPPKDKQIDTIIINGSECEPYLSGDHRILLEETDAVIRGVRAVLRVFNDAAAIISVKAHKTDAINLLIDKLRGDKDVRVAPLSPKYPAGSEKHLVRACLKREIPAGGLPYDVGVIVLNVETVLAIDAAVASGRPLTEKILTTGGGAVMNPGNYRARIGMSYRDFMEATGGFKTEPRKMISGGPMTGACMFTLDVPIVKFSSAFICLTDAEAGAPEEIPCVRCGKCVDACPMGLVPLDLYYYILHDRTDDFLNGHGTECVECGACSYVCPSKRFLAASIRVKKRENLYREAGNKIGR